MLKKPEFHEYLFGTPVLYWRCNRLSNCTFHASWRGWNWIQKSSRTCIFVENLIFPRKSVVWNLNSKISDRTFIFYNTGSLIPVVPVRPRFGPFPGLSAGLSSGIDNWSERPIVLASLLSDLNSRQPSCQKDGNQSPNTHNRFSIVYVGASHPAASAKALSICWPCYRNSLSFVLQCVLWVRSPPDVRVWYFMYHF